ncbi:hypothetical protein, partial [Lacticaseibacillus rhamnosus]|uniref:hypothetical protein n=1 Tax=Lacticaseibacillus rhamnosus TaxID=47715 RepID=UPI001CDA6113
TSTTLSVYFACRASATEASITFLIICMLRWLVNYVFKSLDVMRTHNAKLLVTPLKLPILYECISYKTILFKFFILENAQFLVTHKVI